MTTLEWILLSLIIAGGLGAQWYFYFMAQKFRREAREAYIKVRKANADFAEAAALLKYGAVQEAIELLAKYDREDT